MCRIAAIISKDPRDLAVDITKMTNAMVNGGPDDSGFYMDENNHVALGHRRLSIIDLSNFGRQPMLDLTGRYVLIFNGEIYNYLILKRELLSLGYGFRSTTDTEVLLNGYSEWGTTFFSKLEGMFSFVLFDRKNNEIIAGRDPAGIKPLYFAKNSKGYYFSSEIRGLKSLYPNWPEFSKWKIFLLTFGFVPEPYTILDDVIEVPKGNYVRVNLTKDAVIFENYVAKNLKIEIFKKEDAVSLIRSITTKAIHDHLLSDAPVGVFLSGGIDSSIITLIAQKHHKHQLKSLSLDFTNKRYSESYFQDLIVNKSGVNHTKFILDYNAYIGGVSDFLKAIDQPSIDGMNTYFISKYAKEMGLKVVLSGLGADEIFGGYASFSKRYRRINQFRSASKFLGHFAQKYPIRKIKFLQYENGYNEYLFNRGLFVPEDICSITGYTVAEINSVLNSLTLPPYFGDLDSMRQVSFLESDIYMQNQLLRDSDVFSMCHGLEIRVPFLDKNLLDLVSKIDPKLLFGDTQKKHLLVEAFKHVLPLDIYNRRKSGFELPFGEWFAQSEFLKDSNFLPEKWRNLYIKGRINYSQMWAIFLSNYFSR